MPQTGIRFCDGREIVEDRFNARLKELELHQYVETTYRSNDNSTTFSLRKEFADSWVPHNDTTQLSRYIEFSAVGTANYLECEILLAMLAAPRCLEYPNYEEFLSSVHIRCNIVRAAERTQLAFHTSEAERPEEFWTYVSNLGFTILPGKSLITALEKATQPEVSGKLYSFSCYRATEYVILLGIARELAIVNPGLLTELEQQWERQPIMSGKFHDVFLYEYGSMHEPLPPRYYVPGDRVWFRNPDERSSDVSGYEGSWVFYLGRGLFSNFWKRDQPYTLTTKCVEIFHWRHGVFLDSAGEPRMDEAVVDARKRETFAEPEEVGRIFERMVQLRDPTGVYANGGCIDASREFPKWICPGSEQIVLPARQFAFGHQTSD